MKFPQLIVDQKDYEKQLADLLDDLDCQLLFDTNILSQMFSLHKPARGEFAAWLQAQKIPEPATKRVALPAWCLHEYTNRVIRKRLSDYMPVGTSIANTSNYSRQLVTHLTMSVDDELARKRSHDSRADFIAKLEVAHEAFIKLLPKPDTDADALQVVHDEVVAMFGDSVLKSDIFSLLKTCQADYAGRYDNHLPPGFMDDSKEKNKIGDYVIWCEILASAATGRRKFIYISKDSKIDWVYAPLKSRLSNGKFIDNTNKKLGPIIHLIDPRLEHELSLAAGAEVEIMIITFEQLVKVLVHKDDLSFKQLASAVQLIKEQVPTIAVAEEKSFTTTTVTVDLVEPLLPIGEERTIEVHQVAVTDTDTPPAVQYPNWVLADHDYVEQETPVDLVTERLQFYNWDAQNAAINSLTAQMLAEANPNELFVLGRNILQAADGSSFAAIELITDFPGRISKAPEQALRHLLNGILYEVYFDKNNVFRYSNGKASQLNDICLVLNRHTFLQPCATFITQHLTGVEFERYVLFIPFLKQQFHTITLLFISNPNTSKQLPILQSVAMDDELEPITVNIPEGMGNPSEPELMYLRYFSRDLDRLVAAIAFSRYIPREYVNVVCKLDSQQIPEGDLEAYNILEDLAV